jgi:hypothetical protein
MATATLSDERFKEPGHFVLVQGSATSSSINSTGIQPPETQCCQVSRGYVIHQHSHTGSSLSLHSWMKAGHAFLQSFRR